MKILSWNINSVRLRQNALARLLRRYRPDVLCLQETKVPDPLFPLERFEALGYQHHVVSGQKGYHGVAILSRRPLTGEGTKRWCGSRDCRHAFAVLPGGIELHNVYAPAGGDIPDPETNPKFAHKLRFYRAMTRWFRSSSRSAAAVLVGDLNVAPLPSDVWSHQKLRRVVTHTPIEVEAMTRLRRSRSWVDALRYFVPESERLFTWWSYRAADWKRVDKGRRLDHAWVTPELEPSLRSATVLKHVRGWKAAVGSRARPLGARIAL